MTISVVRYHSGMASPPALPSLTDPGALVNLLKAVLVDGFNTLSATSVTRSGATVTLQTTSNHPYAVNEVVEVMGADQSAYNGWKRVLSVPAANQITFAVGSAPASPATGTITIRHPPAGWTATAAGTNNYCFRTRTAGSQGHYIQIEDNNPYAEGSGFGSTQSARTRLAAGWTGLDTALQLGEQCRAMKAYTAATRHWFVVADYRTCYVVIDYLYVMSFGEFDSFLPGDGFPMFANRGRNASAGAGVMYCGDIFPAYSEGSTSGATTQGATCLRDYTQAGAHVNLSPILAFLTSVGPMPSQAMTTPNPVDGKHATIPAFLVERAGTAQRLRGKLRGLELPLGQVAAGSFTSNQYHLDDEITSGTLRRMTLVRANVGSGLGNEVQLAFNTGDTWD